MAKKIDDIFLFPGSLDELNNFSFKPYELVSLEPMKIQGDNLDKLETDFKQLLINKNFEGIIRYSVICKPLNLAGVTNSKIDCSFYGMGLPVIKSSGLHH